MTMLSVLICTTPERKVFFETISRSIHLQAIAHNLTSNVEILYNDEALTIGEKRNKLLQSALGSYICFVDDDDEVSNNYITDIIYSIAPNYPFPSDGINIFPDCLSLRGIMTTDGENPEVFEHSLKYPEWKDNGAAYPNIRYERYPNHLNVIRADIAKQFKFPETNHGEDFEFSKALHESGLLKNEVFIDKILYYYKYRTNK